VLLKKYSWPVLAFIMLIILLMCQWTNGFHEFGIIEDFPMEFSSGVHAKSFNIITSFSSEIPTDTDTDGDGIDDAHEFAGDTDGDGLPDYLDSDDDGDGIPTIAEGSNPDGDGNPADSWDTDDDGIPNYLDSDDDGDGIPSATEYEDSLEFGDDIDGDGIPNWLDTDSDGDGILDEDEGIVDVDEDGIPDYLDPVDSGRWILCSEWFGGYDCLDANTVVTENIEMGDCVEHSLYKVVIKHNWIYSDYCPKAGGGDTPAPPKGGWPSASISDDPGTVAWGVYDSFDLMYTAVDSEPTNTFTDPAVVYLMEYDGTTWQFQVSNNLDSFIDENWEIEIYHWSLIGEGEPTPGFEIFVFIISVGICILLLKKKRCE